MKRRKRAWMAVVLVVFFGGPGYFYFGLWIRLAGTLAWFGALSLMNWIVRVWVATGQSLRIWISTNQCIVHSAGSAALPAAQPRDS
jgi:hypothetical protein